MKVLVVLAAVIAVSLGLSSYGQEPDKRCHHIGQYLRDGYEKCTFLRCTYGQEPWYDRYGRIQLFAERQQCAGGTEVNDYFNGYENPCTVRSYTCQPKVSYNYEPTYENSYGNEKSDYGYERNDYGYQRNEKRDYGYEQEEYGYETQEYAPKRNEYAPKKTDYAPKKDEYAPKKNEYAPKKNEYAPKKDEYAPKKNDYAPKKNEYAPKKNEYAPKSDYAPKKEGYSEEKKH